VTARCTFVCAGLAALAAVSWLAPVAEAAATPAAGSSVNARPLFTANDLLLLEVRLGDTLLTDALGAYSSRAGVYLPLGELARLLDLAIIVDPPGQLASGWFLAPGRTFMLDLGQRTAESEGRPLRLDATDAMMLEDEIYVRTDVLGRLLPLGFDARRSESLLTITSQEPLPFQQKLEREQRRAGLGTAVDAHGQPLRVALPYRLFSAPALDLNLALGASNQDPDRSTQWDLRLAGDLAYMGMQAYVASNDDGTPETARLLFERRGFSADGSGATSGPAVSAGDVYTPVLSLGMTSRGGRGFSYSNEPRARASVFDSIDLRGEMPTGFEAELYVNEVLRASQPAPIAGRYEFAGVPLTFGLNVVRIVFFGPRGERFEEVRQINVGSGQLPVGQTEISVGAVEQGVALVDLTTPAVDPVDLDPGHGDVAYSAMITHGITDRLTARLGTGRYTPYASDTRNLANLALSAAIGAVALQFDYSRDDGDGRAQSLGLAGRLGEVPLVLRHNEYQGNYADEMSGSAIDAQNPLRRLTDLRSDFAAPLPGTERSLPATLTVRRDERVDDSARWEVSAQATAPVGRTLLSGGLAYNHDTTPGQGTEQTLNGSFDASTILGSDWQVRASLACALVPAVEAVSSALTVDRNLSTRLSLHGGVQQDWGETRYTSFSGSATWRLPYMDVTAGGSYLRGLGLWSAGLQFSTGALFDPLKRRYRSVRPGTTTGGALALEAFVDANGDGLRQSGEAGQPGLRTLSGEFVAPSDARGDLLVAGLGDTGTATVSIDLQSIEDPFLKPPAPSIEVLTRPGRVAVARYALQASGEVTVRFVLPLPQGTSRGIAALSVELVDGRDRVVARGRTEYDGTVLFEGLAPGRYTVRLDAEQSDRLRMSLMQPLELELPPGGGYAGTFDARVAIAR
jgi:hypothetical protein